MSEEKYQLRTVRSFVRRQGRLTRGQERALLEYWPLYGLDISDGPFWFEKIFQNSHSTILDIGFGTGESLVTLAKNYPQYNFIGVDVHRPGVGATLIKIHQEQLTNIRVVSIDALEVLRLAILPHSLAAILLFFPDPWPKRRHHKRRLIQTNFLHLIAEKLQRQGLIQLATDSQDYALYIASIFSLSNQFCQTFTSLLDRPPTKYAQRGARLGHQEWDLSYVLK